MKNEVKFTGQIPICPNCKVPTKRTGGTMTMTTMYFPPTYDENGVNTNPDRNNTTTGWQCEMCAQNYHIRGNSETGYVYC